MKCDICWGTRNEWEDFQARRPIICRLGHAAAAELYYRPPTHPCPPDDHLDVTFVHKPFTGILWNGFESSLSKLWILDKVTFLVFPQGLWSIGNIWTLLHYLKMAEKQIFEHGIVYIKFVKCTKWFILPQNYINRIYINCVLVSSKLFWHQNFQKL